MGKKFTTLTSILIYKEEVNLIKQREKGNKFMWKNNIIIVRIKKIPFSNKQQNKTKKREKIFLDYLLTTTAFFKRTLPVQDNCYKICMEKKFKIDGDV